jgi:hypothetical protein
MLTLPRHGFIDLDQSKQREEQDNNAILHPETDLLHLGPNSSWIWGPRSSTRRFAACGALDKIRCVAIMNPRSDLAAVVQFESLRRYANLEVVFIIVQISVRASTIGWKEKEWVKFREVDDEKAATLIYYGRRFPAAAVLNQAFTQERREQMQGMMARGPQRAAPHVVFMEEIRAWDEETSR